MVRNLQNVLNNYRGVLNLGVQREGILLYCISVIVHCTTHNILTEYSTSPSE